jgi:hypothetical protein
MTDETRYAVYVIAVEDTQKAFEHLVMNTNAGIVSWSIAAHDKTETTALEIVDNLAEFNFDPIALAPR